MRWKYGSGARCTPFDDERQHHTRQHDACAYQKVNQPASPHIPAPDLNAVRPVNSLCRSTRAVVVANVVVRVERMGTS
jgi:hypothetical protein